jgi:hypothetical protein
MPLDAQETISRLQSASVRNSLILIAVNGLALFAAISGKTFDIESIQKAMETWLPLLINAASMLWGWNAYRGRVTAETKIEPLPWRTEIATLLKPQEKV